LISVGLVVIFLFSQNQAVFSMYSSFRLPPQIWTSFSPRPLRKISRLVRPQWHWGREDILTNHEKDQMWLSLPESKVQYTPLAPILPYLEYSLSLQENEALAFIRVTKVMWEKLPIQSSQLAKHSTLFSFEEETVLPASLGVCLPDCYPQGSFEYTIGQKDRNPVLNVKLYPIHTWDNSVWLTEQLHLEIGICASQVPEKEENDQKHSVIITPTELLDEARELGQYHQENGLTVDVVPLSHIQNWKVKVEPVSLSYMVGYREANESETSQIPEYDFETADQIRTYLIHLLKLGHIDYLTLFGDASFIPPSEYVISTRNADPYDKMIPTDLFYMAPEAFGREIPLRIVTGRIPIRTKEEARLYLDKNVQFRHQDSTDWIKSAALFGGDMFDDDYYGELQCSFMKNSGVFGDFSIKKYYQTDNQYNRDVIAEVMKTNPYGFMVMSSHGRGDYLRLPGGYLDSSEVIHQPSTSHYPIWVSNSCLNGSWDTRLSGIRYGTDRTLQIPTSFSESLLFSKGGAIAYVGGARVNYAGMAYQSNLGEIEVFQLYNIDAMIQYFFESYQTQEQTLGEIFFQSVRKFIQYDFDNGYDFTLKTLFGWCLLGDPTLSLPGKKATDGKPAQIMKMPPTLTGPWEESTPFLDLSQKNSFIVNGKTKTLKVSLCDYNHFENGSIVTVLDKKTTGESFHYTLPSMKKTRFALRFEDLEGFETRYVAYGRYPDDIEIKTPSIFRHLVKDSLYEFSIMIRNNGYNSAKEVMVDQVGDLEKKSLLHLPNLDSFTDYSVPVLIDTSQTGHFRWKFSCTMQAQDLDDSDNSIEMEFWITDLPTHRIGVVSFTWEGPDGKLSQKLSLPRLNQYYQDQSLPIEVKALHQDDLNNLQALSLSTLVLYNIKSISDKQLLKKIVQFEKDGGSILVMGSFDNQLISLMGIRQAADFVIRNGDSSFQPFKMMKSKEKFFSSPSYSLPCFESYSIYQSDITESLLNSAFIVGYSDDAILYILQNRRWISYSGMVPYLDFTRSTEPFLFFADLLGYCVSQELTQE